MNDQVAQPVVPVEAPGQKPNEVPFVQNDADREGVDESVN